MTVKEESRLIVRTDKTIEVGKKYMEKNCDREGKPLRGGFTPDLERGIQKITERVKSGEVIVRPTDKSKRLCMSTYKSYIRQGNKHVGTDREIGEEEVRSIQRTVNTTT